MRNWASRKEASSLVSSKDVKSIGAFLQTSLNWVILFFMLLILRYPMMGLLVYNFLKFIIPSMSRLWLVFLALLLIWSATLSRCFLKFALKNMYYLHWVEKMYIIVWKIVWRYSGIVIAWFQWFRTQLLFFISYFRMLSINFLASCRTPLLFKCIPLLFRWLLLIFHCDWISPIFIARCLESVLMIRWDMTICVAGNCSTIDDFNSNSFSVISVPS